jgi:hypothetical protein
MRQLTAFEVLTFQGAAISILVLLKIEKKPLSQEYLRRFTGYCNENIHDALLLLRDADLIVQTGRYEWSLTNGAQQLPLGELALPEPDQPTEEPENERIAIQAIDVLPEEPEQKEFRSEVDNPCPVRSAIIGPNPLASSSRSINQESRENLLLARAASSGNSGANSQVADNLAELDRLGIFEPARSELARLDHVIPELIEYHITECGPTGQAVYRIRNNWRIKKSKKLEDENDRKKYISGEYADFIEH